MMKMMRRIKTSGRLIIKGKLVLLCCINLTVRKWSKLPSVVFDFNMSLLSHVHNVPSIIFKLLIIYNGIKKGTNFPIIINLPLVFIRRIIFIIFAEIYLLCDGYLWLLWNR